MVIVASQLVFAVPPEHSTRALGQKIKDHVWSRFKISVAELPKDNADQLVIGIAVVGGEEASAKHRSEQVISHLRDWGVTELLEADSETIHFEDLELERDFEKFNP